MAYLLNDVESWIGASLIGVLMVAGWYLGYRRGNRLTEDEREKRDSTFGGASMALLGLLLGFTFSMSLSKHDQRRVMVVSDSNSIGDFATTASYLKEPVRGKLLTVIRDYARHRLDTAHYRRTADFEVRLVKAHEYQQQMQDLVAQAVNEGTPVAIPLVNTFNDLTSNHSARVAAGLDRLPPIIFVLLAAAAAITMALIGNFQGAGNERRLGGTFGFVLLVVLVVWVILDLNQPHRGMITVSQDSMRRTVESLN